MKYRTRCCNEIIESTYRHDFKQCPCGQCFVDGGDDYMRVGFETLPPERLIESETENE